MVPHAAVMPGQRSRTDFARGCDSQSRGVPIVSDVPTKVQYRVARREADAAVELDVDGICGAVTGDTRTATRIGIVVHSLQRGGAENSVFRLARFLREAGHEVEFVTTSRRGEWFDRPRDLGFPTHHIEGRERSHPLFHAARVGRRLAIREYSLIFLSNEERHAQAAIPMLPATTCVVPMIRSDCENAYRVARLNRHAWNVAVAVSPKVETRARQAFFPRPVVKIENGVTLPDQARWQRRRHHELPLRLVYVGRIAHDPKGVLFLPEIVARCRRTGVQVRLDVVGAGPDEDRLRRRIAELGVSECCQLLGPLPNDEVFDLLLDSHVLLAPSLYEGLPGAPLEAQACGCVPIASRLPGITDAVMEPAVTGLLVDVGHVEGFAQAVAELATDSARWAAMSRRGANGFLERIPSREWVNSTSR